MRANPGLPLCVNGHVPLGREPEPKPGHGPGSGPSSRAFHRWSRLGRPSRPEFLPAAPQQPLPPPTPRSSTPIQLSLLTAQLTFPLLQAAFPGGPGGGPRAPHTCARAAGRVSANCRPPGTIAAGQRHLPFPPNAAGGQQSHHVSRWLPALLSHMVPCTQ